MKKQKLTLKDLKVKSFVTNKISNSKLNTIAGGEVIIVYYTDHCNTGPISNLGGVGCDPTHDVTIEPCGPFHDGPW